ncbi:MAG: aspartate kinase [Candidatus Heimdallarchaeota archaeon]|nr:aspartate kinase [Candidatus Heimdallarchaeota archaeon]
MDITIQKFGGLIASSSKNLNKIVNILVNFEGKQIAVVSASYGTTKLLKKLVKQSSFDTRLELLDILMRKHITISSDFNYFKDEYNELVRKVLAVELLGSISNQLEDEIISFGEKINSRILFHLLSRQKRTILVDPRDILVTNGIYGSAEVLLEKSESNNQKLLSLLEKYDIIIIPGYYGGTQNGNISLLGDSGSDYAATSIGYVVDAIKINLWKAVQGFMSADPDIIEDAILIPELKYEEAAELSYYGAGILHPKTILPAKLKNIPIEIINFERSETSTKINAYTYSELGVKSISSIMNLVVFQIQVITGGNTEGILSQITSIFQREHVNIISISTSHASLAIVINQHKKEILVRELYALTFVEEVIITDEQALICIVGSSIGVIPGIAAKVFSTLAEKKINISFIASGASDYTYHFLVPQVNLKESIRLIHREFFKMEILL